MANVQTIDDLERILLDKIKHPNLHLSYNALTRDWTVVIGVQPFALSTTRHAGLGAALNRALGALDNRPSLTGKGQDNDIPL